MYANCEPAVEARALRKSFGDMPVLDGLSLSVPRGSVFALLGPNGSGKTTTVRILATLLAADDGEARVAGCDVRRARASVRRRISLTGQYVALDELQTGEENLMMVGRLAGLGRRAARRRAGELLDRFDLAAAAERRVATYSGGMRRRLDLAASIVSEPEVLFLDEPTTGLDPSSRLELWSVVSELVSADVTVFLTTQYLEEADRLAGHIAVLDGGRIVAEGTAAELKRRVAETSVEVRLQPEAPFGELVARCATRVLSADPATGTFSLSTDGSAGDVRALLDTVDPERSEIAEFALRMPTLDDVFLMLTGHTTHEEAIHV